MTELFSAKATLSSPINGNLLVLSKIFNIIYKLLKDFLKVKGKSKETL